MMEAKFRIPRIFSNNELKKFAHFFTGRIINISGWTDEDKEGGFYRDYFMNCTDYVISNYDADKKGLIGAKDEIFLDLEADLPNGQQNTFDVCFNHTTLEHIYNFQKAFKNICLLSKDVVIIVVPYIQQLHGSMYPDYWRFTPYAMRRLYRDNGLKLRYCSANGRDKASIYLFCIGYKNSKWDSMIPERFDIKNDLDKDIYADDYKNVIGGNVVE